MTGRGPKRSKATPGGVAELARLRADYADAMQIADAAERVLALWEIETQLIAMQRKPRSRQAPAQTTDPVRLPGAVALALFAQRRHMNIKRLPPTIFLGPYATERTQWVQDAIAEARAEGVGELDLVRERRGRYVFRKPGRRGADAVWPPRPPGEREFLAQVAQLLDEVRKRDPAAMASVRARRSALSRARHDAIVADYIAAASHRDRSLKALARRHKVSVRQVGEVLRIARKTGRTDSR